MKAALKFLVDVGVGKNAEGWLRSQGFDTTALRDIDPRMADQDAQKLASTEGRIVITMDKDFGELVYRLQQKHVGVLLLRMNDAHKDEKLTAIKSILSQYGDQLNNSFSTFRNGKLRIRK